MKGMLFTEVPTARLTELAEDPDWVFQQKMDGTRALVTISPDGIRFGSRNGTALKHAAAALHFDRLRAALAPMRDLIADGGEIVLDGELLIGTGTLHIFDLIRFDGTAGRATESTAQADRYSVLEVLMKLVQHPVYLVRQAETTEGKAEMARAALLAGAEGIVAKRIDGPYQQGARVDHTVKIKFVKTADVVVLEAARGRNEAGREIGNITFGVYGELGSLLTLGRCSIIGKPHVEPGDVIEIAYLKFETAPVQPRMVRVREDKSPVECGLDQFPAYSYGVI